MPCVIAAQLRSCYHGRRQADALDACASTIFKEKNLFIKVWSCDLDLQTSDLEWS